MCNILIGKAGNILEVIDYQWIQNSDGAGLAVPVKDGWYFRRGIMTLKELKEELKKHTDKELIIVHVRLATAGGVRPQMTHPFQLTELVKKKHYNIMEGITDKLLFHNGVISGMGEKTYSCYYGGCSINTTTGESDTAELARLISLLPAHIAIEYAYDTNGGKFAVTDFNGEHKLYITENFRYNEEHEIITSAGL